MKNKNVKEPYPKSDGKVDFIFGIADNSLILAQRLSELTGHGPSLETDIAISNIALDLFGQVRSYYQYAAEIKEGGTTEDDLAFLRTEREYRNVLLVEQPNTDMAYVLGRQFLFDHFHFLSLEQLQKSHDVNLAAIANKSIKEVAYHKDFSSEWIIRLGDGTEESHRRMQAALNDLWAYTEEFFEKTRADIKMINKGVGVDYQLFKDKYYRTVSEIIKKATLKVPEIQYFKKGGKQGIHTEYMGHLLSDMQYMQRTYPGMEW